MSSISNDQNKGSVNVDENIIGTVAEVSTVYLVIPTSWIPIYRKLLLLVSDAGTSIINDCSYGCKGDGSIVFNCWNIFQSACAAYANEEFDKATFFISYVNKQITKYNASHNIKHSDTTYNYNVTTDGTIKAEGTTNNGTTKFYMNKTTYEKYQQWLIDNNNGALFIK